MLGPVGISTETFQLQMLPQAIENLYSKRLEQDKIWVIDTWPQKSCGNDEAM